MKKEKKEKKVKKEKKELTDEEKAAKKEETNRKRKATREKNKKAKEEEAKKKAYELSADDEKSINDEIQELEISESEEETNEIPSKTLIGENGAQETKNNSEGESDEDEEAEQVKKIVGGTEYIMEKGDKEKCLYLIGEDKTGICVGTYDEENDVMVPLSASEGESDDEE